MRIADFFLLPNLFSLSRIFLTPLLAWLLASTHPHASLWAAGVLIAAGITDWLDGYFARRSGEITPLGIALDPVADKIFAGITVILLVLYREFPLWLAFVIVGRDLLIVVVGALLLRGKKITLPSNLTGKYAFGAIATLIGCSIIRFPFGIALMTILSILLIVVSLVNYARVAWRIRNGKEAPQFTDSMLKHLLRVSCLTGVILRLVYELWKFYKTGSLGI